MVKLFLWWPLPINSGNLKVIFSKTFPISQRLEYLEEDEEFYDDYSSRRELFQLTDRDGDGFVTRDEYVLQNGNTTAVVDQVFMAYDGDGDGRFSEEEFLQQSSPLEVHAGMSGKQ